MEGIVDGIAQINFHKNLGGIPDENSAPNFAMESSTSITVSDTYMPSTEELLNACVTDAVDNSTLFSSSDIETIGNSSWEEVEENKEKLTRNRKGYTLAERRQMPTRASKECSLLGIKRRTIMKPSKRVKNNEDFQNLKPADIKKIYLNKKLTNFKPSSLETIFEESSTIQNNEEGYIRLMGGRKIKRSLSCTDGFRYSKTLVNKRRAKIKKTFGKRFALKKISLDEFIIKLNDSIEKNDSILNHNSMEQQHENKRNFDETATQFPSSEMFVSNISESVDDDAMIPKNVPTTDMSTEFTANMLQ